MEQTSIFDFINNDYKITKPIRIIELFAGIGSQAKALKNIGANFEHYKVVEFDKYAIKSYNAVHGTNFETSDITQVSAKDLEIVDTDKYEYIMTYSFPCQDLSIAGRKQGMEKGSGTRSGLLWEVERILNECDELPQVLLMENVPQVHGKKNIDDFKQWISALEKLGYSSFWQDLNACDYGIPQNRNRCFMISILGDYTYEFSKPIELKLKFKDLLENEVDKKYYLKKFLNIRMTEKYIQWSNSGKMQNSQQDRSYYLDNECMCTLSHCNCNGDKSQIVLATKEEVLNIMDCLDSLRIRKLTPKECFRLMGFGDDDYEKAAKVNSNTQLYKQAGNSIVVNVLEEIFKQLLM